MRLNYNPAEDRVRLILPHGGASIGLWLTRRQCIRLLISCLQAPAGREPPGPKDSNKPGRQAADAPDPLEPPTLARLGLRESDGALLVRFKLADEKVIGFRLNDQQRRTLANALRNLERQARWGMFEAALEAKDAAAALRPKLH